MVAEERLSSFKALLQTDGYRGYEGLRKRQGITGFRCITHARRKFIEVLKITKNPNGLAASVIEQLKPLYALEERMKQSNVTFHTRKRLRQKYAWPRLKSLHCWLKQKVPDVPPKSKLGEAFRYMLKQWSYLIAYLRHGSVEIDPNQVENKLSEIKIAVKSTPFGIQ
jgi:transposase